MTDIQKAVIKLLNDKVRECESDDDYLKLAGKLLGSKVGKRKLFETLGLEAPEETKEPVNTEEPAEDPGSLELDEG